MLCGDQSWTWVGSISGLGCVGLGREITAFSWVGGGYSTSEFFVHTGFVNSCVFIVILPITSNQHYSRKSCSSYELRRYKHMSSSASRLPLLPFWQKQSAQFPVLSHTVRSSTQSERDFSSVGRTITDARSQLSASKVESLHLL